MATKQFKIASFNMEKGHKDEQVLGDIRQVIKAWKPAYIGLQEAREYTDALGDPENVLGYALALPKGTKAGSNAQNNPHLYDPKQLHLLRCEAIKFHGGKAGQFPERNDTWGQYVWKAGDRSVIYLNNTHVNSHIEAGGRPIQLPRLALSAAHFEKIAQITKGHASGYALAFLNGDLNVDEDKDNKIAWHGFPEATFKRHDIESVYDELRTPASFDTHGSRKIDVIASYKGDKRVKAQWVKRLDSKTLVSDHSAVCAAFSITLRR